MCVECRSTSPLVQLATKDMSTPEPCKPFRKQSVFSFLNHIKDDNCVYCQTVVSAMRYRSKFKRWALNALWFVVGAIASPLVLYVIATYWPVWPASHVSVVTQGLRISRGTAAGCLAYIVNISTDEGFDDAYLKIRFPMNVSSLRVGTLSSDALSTEQSMRSMFGEIAKDEHGICYVRQTSKADESEVQAKIIKKAVVIQMGKTQRGGLSMVFAVGQDEQVSANAEPPLAHEGHFNKSLLAYSAGRVVSFQDNPVVDTN
jgi:hypothetical protein